MAKKFREMILTDIPEFCKGNKVLKVEEIQRKGVTSVKVTTLKGDVIFEDVTIKKWKTFYCSCTNIKTAHYTTVANILKTALQKTDVAYIEIKSDNLD